MDHTVGEVLHVYIKSLRRYAISLTRDSNEADDLVQECLKRALTYIHDGGKILNMRAYLFTILHNVHRDEMGRRQRNGTPVPIDTDSIRLAYAPPQDTHMECRDLSEALDKLPTDQRQVVLLVGLEGLSYQTAAEVLGIPIGTVMSRLSRGRNALRNMTAIEMVTQHETKKNHQQEADGRKRLVKGEKTHVG
jgi:RNA polymerase sigma-70 factor (ECF subfamily)